MMLPLSPRVCALCYDGDVYNVQNVNGWGEITKINDVLAINEHQYLKCMENIYFTNWEELESIKEEFAGSVDRRLIRSWKLTVADLVGSDKQGETFRAIPEGAAATSPKSLLHMQASYPVPQRWPSVIRYRPNPSIFTDGSAMGFVRKAVVEAEEGTGRPAFTKYKGSANRHARP
jgi:hypothetical protein